MRCENFFKFGNKICVGKNESIIILMLIIVRIISVLILVKGGDLGN